jgi:Cu/Ag efflux pump CusA
LTLAVVNGVKQALKNIQAAAPAGLKITQLFDQSVFVTSSVEGVLREGAIAAGLTALVILIFLGSWRSTLVVMISIPLASLFSLIVLYLLGETLNTMTLGGRALAVGILVDDSTVTIENTHRLLTEERMQLAQATLSRSCWNSRSYAGVHARHQLRIHIGSVPRRTRHISVYAAGARDGVRNARFLWPVADIDPDHDRPAAERRAAPRIG